MTRDLDYLAPHRRHPWVDFLLIAPPAFYVPMMVVASSGIGIGHPWRLMLFGGLVWGFGALFLIAFRRLGVGGSSPVLGVWLCTYLFMTTGAIPDRFGYLLGLTLIVAAVAISLYLIGQRPEFPVRLFLGLASVLLLVEVSVAGYATMSEFGESRVAISLSSIEVDFEQTPDVVLVVADAYVGVDGLSRYFDVDSLVKDVYSRSGFWVPDLAFSPYTSTEAALTAVLDMSYPLAAGPGITRATRRDLYERVGGNNRVVEVFRQNGYQVTMLESGWSGSICGEAIDHCPRPFIDEGIYVALADTWIRDLVLERFGYAFTVGARSTMSWLNDNLGVLVTDEKPDFVIAHLEIPHPPLFLDSDCELVVTPDRSGVTMQQSDIQIEDRKMLYLGQAACVDSFVTSLAESLPPEVVLVLTGDHGTDSHHQLAIHPQEWSLDMIRERLNTMFAFRGPEECRPPEPVLIADLFRHLFSCLSDETLPVPAHRLYIYGVLEFDGAPSPIVDVNVSLMKQLLFPEGD